MNRGAQFLLRRLLAAAWVFGATGPMAAPDLPVPQAVHAVPALSSDALQLLQWVRSSGDAGGAPFIVIDKRQAHLWVFDAEARPLGHTPVLLGLAPGDRSVPGIGERAMADIQPHERTTPAGRFVTEAGHNARGEDIFWIDYDAAVSMHRVRAQKAAERRLQRLASPTPADNRISYGCINVPAEFYDAQIRRLFSLRQGRVYVLPDTLPLRDVFGTWMQARASR